MTKKNNKRTRREFLVKLASGTTAIAGYMLIPDISQKKTTANTTVSNTPRLNDKVIINSRLNTISYGQGENQFTCSLNQMGMQIIEKLDGKTRVQQIAADICKENSLVQNEKLETRLALFLVELSKAGFLEDLFIIDIVESYTA
jgi:hypothetical protein